MIANATIAESPYLNSMIFPMYQLNVKKFSVKSAMMKNIGLHALFAKNLGRLTK